VEATLALGEFLEEPGLDELRVGKGKEKGEGEGGDGKRVLE